MKYLRVELPGGGFVFAGFSNKADRHAWLLKHSGGPWRTLPATEVPVCAKNALLAKSPRTPTFALVSRYGVTREFSSLSELTDVIARAVPDPNSNVDEQVDSGVKEPNLVYTRSGVSEQEGWLFAGFPSGEDRRFWLTNTEGAEFWQAVASESVPGPVRDSLRQNGAFRRGWVFFCSRDVIEVRPIPAAVMNERCTGVMRQLATMGVISAEEQQEIDRFLANGNLVGVRALIRKLMDRFLGLPP